LVLTLVLSVDECGRMFVDDEKLCVEALVIQGLYYVTYEMRKKQGD